MSLCVSALTVLSMEKISSVNNTTVYSNREINLKTVSAWCFRFQLFWLIWHNCQWALLIMNCQSCVIILCHHCRFDHRNSISCAHFNICLSIWTWIIKSIWPVVFKSEPFELIALFGSLIQTQTHTVSHHFWNRNLQNVKSAQVYQDLFYTFPTV